MSPLDVLSVLFWLVLLLGLDAANRRSAQRRARQDRDDVRKRELLERISAGLR
jgi:hypothetical protein